MWAGADGSYLIRPWPETGCLVTFWKQTQIQGVYLCVLWLLQKAALPLVCMQIKIYCVIFLNSFWDELNNLRVWTAAFMDDCYKMESMKKQLQPQMFGEQHNLSHWLEVTFSCHDPAVWRHHSPPVGSNMLLHLHPEPPCPWKTKQGHVESDYTPGTLLCPPQSDDQDDRTWIFTAPDVNILACRASCQLLLTYMGAWRAYLCLATLPHLPPLLHLPFHIWITEWTNYFPAKRIGGKD